MLRMVTNGCVMSCSPLLDLYLQGMDTHVMFMLLVISSFELKQNGQSF